MFGIVDLIFVFFIKSLNIYTFQYKVVSLVVGIVKKKIENCIKIFEFKISKKSGKTQDEANYVDVLSSYIF